MPLPLIATLPFLGAILAAMCIRFGRGPAVLAALLANAVALAGILLHAPAVMSGTVVRETLSWVPAMGLDASFFLDGLGLFFAGLILGMGLLILIYARSYLSERDPMGRFLCYLMLFQGAMTGIVLSDNILMLLVFWELTSLSSFLLIGYWKHLPEARQGARMALAVTGGGGLALIAGMLILGQIAGSYDLTDILTQKDRIQADPLYLPALLLILLGAFTKSAQFPFHFWLPHAMAAPTPVSAYLHSATMVKAGIFLLARLWPVLSGTEAWFVIVTTAGIVTMLLGAKVALYKDDLKAVLAYSTVSHLGLITMLLGIGTKAAAAVAMFHILNHATFKAALFMVAGIIDHETGTRDLNRLGGLRRLMPVTFAITALAGLSMAGLPPLNGFLSKEMMLETASHTVFLGLPWLLGVLATAGALISCAYSFRLIAYGFLGTPRQALDHAPHDPGPGLWGPPAFLAAMVVMIGLFPMAMAGNLVDVAASAVAGQPVAVKISHWHGWTAPALWMSAFAVAGGWLWWRFYPVTRRIWDARRKPDAKRLFETAMRAAVAGAGMATQSLHRASLGWMIGTTLATGLALALGAFLTGTHLSGQRAQLPLTLAPVLIWLVLIAAIAAILRLHRDRMTALLLTGIVGLLLSAAFAYLSAPDLALTQLAVEVVTVLLMLIALNMLPKESRAQSSPARRLRDGFLALVTGLSTAALAFALMTREAAFAPISAFHLAQSKPGAGGTNAVNTIIVDFRGYDTFGEIIVLGIAALVVFALTEAILTVPHVRARLKVPNRERESGDRHPMIFVIATRFLMPLMLIVGVFLYLRGHNLPGGGFVAGLVVSIAILLQYIASGFEWSDLRQRFDHQQIVGAGVLVATIAGLGAIVVGLPFLTSGYDYVTLWPLEPIELASAAVFDLGVFLCVLGAVLLSLASLSRLTRKDAPAAKQKGRG